MPPFNETKAKEAIWFFKDRLTHTRGRFSGKPFIPLPWQRKIIWEIFGCEQRPGIRQYDTAYVEIAKKNGKTEFAAGLALCSLVIDEEPGAECYAAATTRDQANVLHRCARQMVRNNPVLADYLEIIDSTKLIRIRNDPESFFQAISAEAGSHDGINPHFAVYDELHRVKNKDLLDVLRYGSDARDQPLFVGLTTAGIRDESPVCWELHEQARQIIEGTIRDPNFYAVIYALEQEADWTEEGKPGTWDSDAGDWGKKPTGWFKANPRLQGNPGGFLDLGKVRRRLEVAKRSPAEENSFRRFRTNQWVAQESRAIQMRDWDACGQPFDEQMLVGKPCQMTLDLSTSRDFTALCLTFDLDDLVYFLWRFWLPADDIELREPRDIANWVRLGLVKTTPGRTIDYGYIRKEINDLAQVYEVLQIGKDPWNAHQIGMELSEQDGFEVVDIRQGYRTMSAPCKEFDRRVLEGSIRHGNNPAARWMVDCYEVMQDPAGTIKPVKPKYGVSRKRIEAPVTAIMGLYPLRFIVRDLGKLGNL